MRVSSFSSELAHNSLIFGIYWKSSISIRFSSIKFSTENFIYGYILWVPMSSINISIKKEAYDFLKNIKTRDKSFSDIILSFKKEQNYVMRFFGILKNIDWNEKEKNIKNLRSSFNKKLQ